LVNKVVYIKKGEVKIFPDGIDYFLSKRTELQKQEEDNEVVQIKKNSDIISRKDRKRIEAEQRQEKYQATKDLIKSIQSLEGKISSLEIRGKKLEAELSDPEFYSKPSLLKEKNLEFTKLQKELEKLIKDWETQSAKLNKIEEKFN